MAKKNADEQNGPLASMTEFESRLVKLLGLLLVQERKQAEQIGLLARAGFQSAEIAAIIGTTRNTVSVELSNQRKGLKNRAKSKRS